MVHSGQHVWISLVAPTTCKTQQIFTAFIRRFLKQGGQEHSGCETGKASYWNCAGGAVPSRCRSERTADLLALAVLVFTASTYSRKSNAVPTGQGQDAGRHIRLRKILAPRRNAVRPSRDAIPIQVPKRAPIRPASPSHHHTNRCASHPATRMPASASTWPRPARSLQR